MGKNGVQVKIWTRRGCHACTQSKQFFYSKKIHFEEHRLTDDPAVQAYFQQQTNHAKTVPQIIINGQRIGGFDDLLHLEKKGKLDQILYGAKNDKKFSFFKKK
jgi:glutaredoxin